jgi:hypothetical protein
MGLAILKALPIGTVKMVSTPTATTGYVPYQRVPQTKVGYSLGHIAVKSFGCATAILIEDNEKVHHDAKVQDHSSMREYIPHLAVDLRSDQSHKQYHIAPAARQYVTSTFEQFGITNYGQWIYRRLGWTRSTYSSDTILTS